MVKALAAILFLSGIRLVWEDWKNLYLLIYELGVFIVRGFHPNDYCINFEPQHKILTPDEILEEKKEHHQHAFKSMRDYAILYFNKTIFDTTLLVSALYVSIINF